MVVFFRQREPKLFPSMVFSRETDINKFVAYTFRWNKNEKNILFKSGKTGKINRIVENPVENSCDTNTSDEGTFLENFPRFFRSLLLSGIILLIMYVFFNYEDKNQENRCDSCGKSAQFTS